MQAAARLQFENLLTPRVRQHLDAHRARRLQRRISADENVLDSNKLRQGLGQRLQATGDHKHAVLDRSETQRALSVAGQNLATNEWAWIFILMKIKMKQVT